MINQKAIRFTLGALSIAIASPVIANPTIIDTETSKIIVYRPANAWTPNEDHANTMLDSIKKKRFAFNYEDEQGKWYRGAPTVFQSVDATPVINKVKTYLESKDWGLSSSPGFNYFTISKPFQVEPSMANKFFDRGNGMYKSLVAMQGDPIKLKERIDGQRTAGTVMAVGSVLVGFLTGGLSGGGAVLGSGIPEGLNDLPQGRLQPVVPIYGMPADLSSAQSIDVRKVVVPGTPIRGMIIIGYKTEKTADIENESLAKAVIALSGADTTESEILASRETDFQTRLMVWNELSGPPKEANNEQQNQ